MNTFWHKLSTNISNINEKIGNVISWISALLVLLIGIDVVMRYLFSDTKAWMTELEWHLFALIFLLGAGFAFKHDKHVRVDLFYANYSPKDKALTNLLGNLILLIPWCIFIIYFSFGYAQTSFLENETSPDPGGLPARYVIKFSITIGFILLL